MDFYTPYVGNAKYCYSNAAAMLLASIGEYVEPRIIEVVTGTGLGATFVKNKNKLYINNQVLEPDLGIKSALELLGYSVVSESVKEPKDFPIDKRAEILKVSKAILGPLDMGYLTYQPNHKYVLGADHFVLALELTSKGLVVHDPAEFPYALLPIKDLERAWKAENMASYKQGYYRYIAYPKKIESVSDDELYNRAVVRFKDIYNRGLANSSATNFIRGRAAIEHLAGTVTDGLGEEDLGHYKYFLFSLAAKRANDFAMFFGSRDTELAENKKGQAKVLGMCHSNVVNKDWSNLSKSLLQLADLEEVFEKAITK